MLCLLVVKGRAWGDVRGGVWASWRGGWRVRRHICAAQPTCCVESRLPPAVAEGKDMPPDAELIVSCCSYSREGHSAGLALPWLCWDRSASWLDTLLPACAPFHCLRNAVCQTRPAGPAGPAALNPLLPRLANGHGPPASPTLHQPTHLHTHTHAHTSRAHRRLCSLSGSAGAAAGAPPSTTSSLRWRPGATPHRWRRPQSPSTSVRLSSALVSGSSLPHCSG